MAKRYVRISRQRGKIATASIGGVTYGRGGGSSVSGGSGGGGSSVSGGSGGGESTTSKVGYYSSSAGGFVGSDGKVFSTSNSSFTPVGYNRVTNIDVGDVIKRSGNEGRISDKEILASSDPKTLIYNMSLRAKGGYEMLNNNKDIARINYARGVRELLNENAQRKELAREELAKEKEKFREAYKKQTLEKVRPSMIPRYIRPRMILEEGVETIKKKQAKTEKLLQKVEKEEFAKDFLKKIPKDVKGKALEELKADSSKASKQLREQYFKENFKDLRSGGKFVLDLGLEVSKYIVDYEDAQTIRKWSKDINAGKFRKPSKEEKKAIGTYSLNSALLLSSFGIGNLLRGGKIASNIYRIMDRVSTRKVLTGVGLGLSTYGGIVALKSADNFSKRPSTRNLAELLVNSFYSKQVVKSIYNVGRRFTPNTKPSYDYGRTTIEALKKATSKESQIKQLSKIEKDYKSGFIEKYVYNDLKKRVKINREQALRIYKYLNKEYKQIQKNPSISVRKEDYSAIISKENLKKVAKNSKYAYHVAPSSKMKKLGGAVIKNAKTPKEIKELIERTKTIGKTTKVPLLLKQRNITKVFIAQVKKFNGVIYGGKAVDFRTNVLDRVSKGLKPFSSDYDVLVKNPKKVGNEIIKRLEVLGGEYSLKPVKSHKGTWSIFKGKTKLLDLSDSKRVIYEKKVDGFFKKYKGYDNVLESTKNKFGLNIRTAKQQLKESLVTYLVGRGLKKDLAKVKVLSGGRITEKDLFKIRKNPNDIFEVLGSQGSKGKIRSKTGVEGIYVSFGEMLTGYRKGEAKYTILRFKSKLLDTFNDFPKKLQKEILLAQKGKVTGNKNIMLQRKIYKFYTDNFKKYKGKQLIDPINWANPKGEQQGLILVGSQSEIKGGKLQRTYDTEYNGFLKMRDLIKPKNAKSIMNNKILQLSIISKLTGVSELLKKQNKGMVKLLKDSYGSKWKQQYKNIQLRARLDYLSRNRGKIEKIIEKIEDFKQGRYGLFYNIKREIEGFKKDLIKKALPLLRSKKDYMKYIEVPQLGNKKDMINLENKLNEFSKYAYDNIFRNKIKQGKSKSLTLSVKGLTKAQVLAEADRILFGKKKLTQKDIIIRQALSSSLSLKGKKITFKKLATNTIHRFKRMALKKVTKLSNTFEKLFSKKEINKIYSSYRKLRQGFYTPKLRARIKADINRRLNAVRINRELLRNRNISRIVRDLRKIRDSRIITRIRTPVRIRTHLRPRTPTRPRTPLRPRTPTRPRTPLRPRTPTRPRTPLTPRQTRLIPPILLDWKGVNSRSFNVLAKVKGQNTKYVRINSGGLRLIDALNYGKYVTDRTQLASFKIMPSGSKVTQKFSVRTGNYKFRYSVKNRQVIVEKRRYRIDYPTEKARITVQGLRALRRIRQQNRFKRFLRKLLK